MTTGEAPRRPYDLSRVVNGAGSAVEEAQAVPRSFICPPEYRKIASIFPTLEIFDDPTTCPEALIPQGDAVVVGAIQRAPMTTSAHPSTKKREHPSWEGR